MDQNSNITKECIHKIGISIAFGLVGFCLDFYPFVFLPLHHKFVFMAGLVFPMIVSLNWGWRYGFVSVTFGVGCQTVWVKGGWESAVTVAISIIWIVWHGWCARRFRRTGEIIWNRYIAEIPFRILSTILLYMTFKSIYQFNPAIWEPESTKTAISMSSASITVLETMVNGYLILLLSDVLIIFGPLRKLFKLEEIKEQKRSYYLLGTCFLVGCIFWVIDAVYSSRLLQDSLHSMPPKGHGSLLDTTLFTVPSYALFGRLSFFSGPAIRCDINDKICEQAFEN